MKRGQARLAVGVSGHGLLRRWLLFVAALPVGGAASLLVLPAAVAGALPVPVRIPAAGARLAVAGPAAEAYPYRVGLAPSLDAYGFVTGQCTSFVAWWLNSHGLSFAVITLGPGGAGSFLNASSWDDAARAAGYRVGVTPVVGAIAQWHANEGSRRLDDNGNRRGMTAGAPGHVAVVTAVLPDGQAEWLEYGWADRAQVHHGSGYAPRYLYLGVNPRS